MGEIGLILQTKVCEALRKVRAGNLGIAARRDVPLGPNGLAGCRKTTRSTNLHEEDVQFVLFRGSFYWSVPMLVSFSAAWMYLAGNPKKAGYQNRYSAQ
jgi:hypothetical protein